MRLGKKADVNFWKTWGCNLCLWVGSMCALCYSHWLSSLHIADLHIGAQPAFGTFVTTLIQPSKPHRTGSGAAAAATSEQLALSLQQLRGFAQE